MHVCVYIYAHRYLMKMGCLSDFLNTYLEGTDMSVQSFE